MNYAFKPPSTTKIQMQMTPEGEPRSSSAAKDIIRNEIYVNMRARVIGDVEACWSLFEYTRLRIAPKVEAYKVHIEGGRQLLLRAEAMQTRIGDSSMIRYCKGPGLYTELKSFDYFEHFRLYRTLPASP